jgi:hypothetical protein
MPPGSGLQVRARAPHSPARSGYACRAASEKDEVRSICNVIGDDGQRVRDTKFRHPEVRLSAPSPRSRGEGIGGLRPPSSNKNAMRSIAMMRGRNRFAQNRGVRPLTRSLRSRPLPAQRGEEMKASLPASWPGLSRPSTSLECRVKTWMPGTRPGMTS